MSYAAAAAATDCATPPSKKGKIGDNLFDVDSDPDLASGRLSSPTSPFSLPGPMTTSLLGQMSPGLSVEGSALLQAINSSLGPRIDTLGSRFDTANSHLASMSHRMINIESAVNSLDGRMSATEKSLEDVRHRTEILERKNVSSTASSISADGGTGSAARQVLRPVDWTPPAKRTIIVVGGFPKDTPKEHIVRQLREIILPDAARGWRGQGVSDCYAPNFSSFGRIKFETSDDMWKFLKAFKGHRFTFNGKILFHSIDKTSAEMDLSRKVSRSLKRLRVCLIERGLMQEETQREDFNRLVVADWDSRIVRYKRSDGSIHRLFELDRGSGMLKVGDGAVSSGLNLRLAEMLPERSTLENRRYPLPWERTYHLAFRCCKLSGGTHAALQGKAFSNSSQRLIKNCLLGICARLLNGRNHQIGQTLQEKDIRSFSEIRKTG